MNIFCIVTFDKDKNLYKVFEPYLEAYTLGPNLIETHMALLARYNSEDSDEILISLDEDDDGPSEPQ